MILMTNGDMPVAEIVTTMTPPPTPNQNGHHYNTVVEDLDLHDMLLQRGTTGLRRASGYIIE
jgi:hypothetical protein